MKCINCNHEHTDHDYLLAGPQFQVCRICDCRRNLLTGVWTNDDHLDHDSGFLEAEDLSNFGIKKDEL
jgi:hypothetical protein